MKVLAMSVYSGARCGAFEADSMTRPGIGSARADARRGRGTGRIRPQAAVIGG